MSYPAFKKLSLICAIALASASLVACGGGSDGSSNNSNNSPEKTQPATPESKPVSDLEQAKELVRTAKLFVTDMDAIKSVYEDAAEVLTEQQINRVAVAFKLTDEIHDFMRENTLTEFTTANFASLNTNIKAVDSKSFKATLDTDDTLIINGHIQISDDDNDTYKVSYNGFKDDATSTTSSKNVNLSFGFTKVVVGSGKEQVTLTSNQNLLTAKGTMSKAVVIDAELFDIDNESDKGNYIEDARLAFENVTVLANSNTITAKELSISIFDIVQNDENGKKVSATVPYKFVIDGSLQQEKPKTNIALTLSVTAKKSDIKSMYIVNKNGNVKEKEGESVPVTANLTVKGDLTKEVGSVIPLDFQASIKRHSDDTLTLENLQAYIEDKNNNLEVTETLVGDAKNFTFKRNDAQIMITLDDDNNIVEAKNGKISDITVNDKDYGDIFDTGSIVTAKFTDNSTISF